MNIYDISDRQHLNFCFTFSENEFKCVDQISPPWENFFKNAKSLSQFFGHNSAFELKINEVVQIDNRLSFLKHPSKSRLSRLIIEIITLKDRQHWPKTTKMGDQTEPKRNNPYTWEAPNISIINVNVHWCTQKIEYLKFVVRAKIQSEDNFQKL